jgi:hypothetical protein
MAKKFDPSESEALFLLVHDINNGLGVITGHCELITEHADLDSECAKHVCMILETVHRLAKRINGIESRVRTAEARKSNFNQAQRLNPNEPKSKPGSPDK